MKHLARILHLIWRAERWALLRGALLSVTVLAAGAALLGLSGWFITAAGAAGLAGGGIAFDVFRPSAGVRMLALGRTAARYGERLLTHDATLSALSTLRTRLLAALLDQRLDRMLRLRGSVALNRLTADVDALDGVTLRLVLPILAAIATHALAFVVLAWLVDIGVAIVVAAGYGVGAALAAVSSSNGTRRAAVLAERSAQALRTRTIDMLQASADLVIHGRMEDAQSHVLEADRRSRRAARRLDQADRRTGLLISVAVTLVAAATLVIGQRLVALGSTDPAAAALGFFAALGLAETVSPFRRVAAEFGRMRDAAGRVGRILETEHDTLPPAPCPAEGAPGLEVANLSYRRPGAARPVFTHVTLAVKPGETLAITGASGAGKSTLLFAMAGLLQLQSGVVALNGTPLGTWDESDLRARLALVPQRTALLGGTILDNLRLAASRVTEAEARAVLEAVALGPILAPRGGLDYRLGERGAGLSGGESRRLALARALLRKPEVLLLDEPTEGLDDPTARRVLAGIRAALPNAAIVTASHRPAETDWADRCIALG
jgi:ATP-binding cassette subfamily C protein CydC